MAWALPALLRAVWPTQEPLPHAVCTWCKAAVWRLQATADGTEVCSNCYTHWYAVSWRERQRRRTCGICGHLQEFHAQPLARVPFCTGAVGGECPCLKFDVPGALAEPVTIPGGVQGCHPAEEG